MKSLNLLPWRQTLRASQTKTFDWSLCVSVGVSTCVALLFYMHTQNKVADAFAAQVTLETEINKMNPNIAEIKKINAAKDRLIVKINSLRALQLRRALTVRLFNALAQGLPPGVYFTLMQRLHNRVTLHGFAANHAEITLLMKNIEKNEWIKKTELKEIKTSKSVTETAAHSESSEFELSFMVQQTKASG